MWRKVSSADEESMLKQAIDFTGNATLYGLWMKKVVDSWPTACEHNLTDTTQNRRAWIGHAAVCLAWGCPEYITRMAWGYLTKKQQDEANDMADMAITIWEQKHGIERSAYAQGVFEY
jgi:hypothetical protein